MINGKKIFGGVILLFCLLFFSGCGHKDTANLSNTEPTIIQENINEIEQIDFESCKELELLGIVDTYDNANEVAAFFEDQDSLDKLISFNQQLNSQFEVYEIYMQPLQSKLYWNIDDSFLKTYNGVVIKNQEIEIEGKNCFISSLNSLQVNLIAYRYFFDYIGEGRGFSESDFQYKGSGKVPIILGNDYKSYYSIGDSIELNYLQKDFVYEIIGFFEQGLKFKIGNSEHDIDRYLCVPFFSFYGDVLNDNERMFWIRYYQERNSSYIKVDMSDDLREEEIIEVYNLKIQKIVEELKLKYSTMEIIYNISSEIIYEE
jgi:hypothetical protein